MKITDIERDFCRDGENVGGIIRNLRGYVTVEGGYVELSGEPLREWLEDCVNNPEFAVGKVFKNGGHIGAGQSFMEV